MPKSLLRSWIESLLPWYHPTEEEKRDARTSRIARRSQIARQQAEQIIAEYRRTEAKAGAAADRLIEEVRR